MRCMGHGTIGTTYSGNDSENHILSTKTLTMELTISIGLGMISVHKKTKTGIVPTTINAEFTNLKE